MHNCAKEFSCHQYTGPTHFLDLPLSLSAEELGLHNHWLPGKVALTKHLIVTLVGEERERRGEGVGRGRCLIKRVDRYKMTIQ